MGQFPNKSTQFQKGQSGNPGGKTSEQRANEIESARIGSIVTLELAKALGEAVQSAEGNTERVGMIRNEVLTFLRDVQNRAHGTPKQTIEQDVTQRTAPKGLDAFYASIDEDKEDEN